VEGRERREEKGRKMKKGRGGRRGEGSISQIKCYDYSTARVISKDSAGSFGWSLQIYFL
jgi:hypothetical protein